MNSHYQDYATNLIRQVMFKEIVSKLQREKFPFLHDEALRVLTMETLRVMDKLLEYKEEKNAFYR